MIFKRFFLQKTRYPELFTTLDSRFNEIIVDIVFELDQEFQTWEPILWWSSAIVDDTEIELSNLLTQSCIYKLLKTEKDNNYV